MALGDEGVPESVGAVVGVCAVVGPGRDGAGGVSHARNRPAVYVHKGQGSCALSLFVLLFRSWARRETRLVLVCGYMVPDACTSQRARAVLQPAHARCSREHPHALAQCYPNQHSSKVTHLQPHNRSVATLSTPPSTPIACVLTCASHTSAQLHNLAIISSPTAIGGEAVRQAARKVVAPW